MREPRSTSPRFSAAWSENMAHIRQSRPDYVWPWLYGKRLQNGFKLSPLARKRCGRRGARSTRSVQYPESKTVLYHGVVKLYRFYNRLVAWLGSGPSCCSRLFRCSGFGFWVSSFGVRVSGFGFRVSGFGFRVSGFGFRVSGFGVRVSGFGISYGNTNNL